MASPGAAREPNWFRAYGRHYYSNPCGGRLLEMQVVDDERVLNLKGVCVDQVEYVSSVISDGTTDMATDMAVKGVNIIPDSWEQFLGHVIRDKGIVNSPTGLSWEKVFL
ncbi:hypothetical protein ACJZ2D_009296 [Fusarium nematophilum]